MMQLSSPSFRDGGFIPRNHTVEGAELSPPLAWSDLPRGAVSLVLLMEDPDMASPVTPGRPFLHWVLYNLQPSSSGIALGANRNGFPAGCRPGRNDHGRAGYSGPAPDVGRHRYLFRLLALDTTLDERALGEDGAPGRGRILAAVEGHVLDSADLTGLYERERRPQAHRPTSSGEG